MQKPKERLWVLSKQTGVILERSVWVGGFSLFSSNDDLLATWEFELPL
jgi:hypothetical protein